MNQWVLDIGQQVALGSDPWNQGNKWDEFYYYDSLLLERVSRLQHREGEPKLELTVLLRWEYSLKFRQNKVARIFRGKCRRGENFIERDLYISVEGILWVFGWVITYSCFWENYMRSQKEPWKRAGRFPRAGNSWYSHWPAC